MRKVLLAIILVMACPLSVFARGHYFGYAQKGGQKVSVAGFSSRTSVQRSFPGATVKVCVAGTSCSSSGGTAATLYSDASGTPLANPLTASSTDASFEFWTDTPLFDIAVYGTGITTNCGGAGQVACTTAFTWTNQVVDSQTVDVFVNVGDFGALGNGTTDDTLAIQDAIDSCDAASGRCVVLFGSKTYKTTDTVTIDKSRVNLLGMGQQATIISFVPTSGKSAFKFDGTAATLAQNSMKGFGFTSSNITFQKVMIEVLDVEEMEISDIASATTLWTGATSIGIVTKGRQTVNLHDCTIFADIPIDIRENPSINIDTDHFHFWNLYLSATGTNPIINVADGVYISNLLIDGFQAWVLGGQGFYAVNTAAAPTSHSVVIKNVRWEQSTNATGYIVYLGRTTGGGYRSVQLENIYGGLNTRGIYMRNVQYPTMTNIHYAGTGVALDIDSTVGEAVSLGSYWGAGGASVSVTGQIKAFASPRPAEASSIPLESTVFFTPSANTVPYMTLHDTRIWNDVGTLANAGTVNIPNVSTATAMIVHVSARNNTTGAVYGGTVVVSNGALGAEAATLVAGTANFNVGNVGGSLTIFRQNATTISLFNQIGVAVDYVITVSYN